MPWKVGVKTPKGYPIKRSDTGKVVGYSDTKEKAQASVRARYASVGAKGETARLLYLYTGWAFAILFGGVVLTLALVVGLGWRDLIERIGAKPTKEHHEDESSTLHHL